MMKTLRTIDGVHFTDDRTELFLTWAQIDMLKKHVIRDPRTVNRLDQLSEGLIDNERDYTKGIEL